MKELFDQIYHQLWVVLHYRWLVLSSTIVICLSGWIVVEYLPDQYEVETKVYLDSRTVLNSLLHGLTVDNKSREQSAEIMKKTLITRPNLRKVIYETDLNLSINNPLEMERMVDEFMQDIKFTSVSLLRGQSSNMYRISYIHDDPELAKKVVDVILNIFVDTILGTSRKNTDKAQAFLDQQIQEYQKKQHEAEQRLKKFKQENVGAMPKGGGNFLATINTLKDRLEGARLLLKEAEGGSVELERQLIKLNALGAKKEVNTTMDEDPLDARINNLEIQLDELLLQYTERHPDVINMRDALAQLKKRKQEQHSSFDEENLESDATGLLADQGSSIALGQSKADVAALRTRVEAYEQQLDEKLTMYKKIPEVEAKFADLNRDYAIYQKLYDDLVMRRETSNLASKAALSEDELRFKIIEPPMVPIRPIGPKRLLFITMVLIAGIGGGIGIAVLYGQVKPAFYSIDQLSENFDIPVLGSVSMFWSDQEQAKRRLGIVLFGIISTILLVAYVSLLIRNGLILR